MLTQARILLLSVRVGLNCQTRRMAQRGTMGLTPQDSPLPPSVAVGAQIIMVALLETMVDRAVVAVPSELQDYSVAALVEDRVLAVATLTTRALVAAAVAVPEKWELAEPQPSAETVEMATKQQSAEAPLITPVAVVAENKTPARLVSVALVAALPLPMWETPLTQRLILVAAEPVDIMPVATLTQVALVVPES
jgi:hypothetical protein